jgi:L-glyceraldehyde 3-phosphate reductase
MPYQADDKRYASNHFRRCGRSGLMLPLISLGLWHNFGSQDVFDNQRDMLRKAFDLGITHFDLANNYGPVGGSAEENFARHMAHDFKPYRDELIISTKAGYGMWPGPYGNKGSRKYLIASLDQSLKRMGLDYVDIFYHHCPDRETPMEESMMALDQIVRSGKALYVGISSYSAEETRQAARILRELGTPCLIHQPSYNMLNRWIEDGLTEALAEAGMGCICFCPLAQGQLTNRYLNGIPKDSRAGRGGFLKPEQITDDVLAKVRALGDIAQQRGQSLAQMALAWVLNTRGVTSALIGASKVSQIEENVAALSNLNFTKDELSRIDMVLNGNVLV